MPRMKYPVREDFFDEWSPEMAYVLGFITADGNIRTKRRVLEITLKDTDVEILEYIRNLLSPTRPITRHATFDKRRNKHYHKVRLSFYSGKIVRSLLKLGLCDNKTGKEIVPSNLPKQFASCYIRGVFDGDGHVMKRVDCPLDSGITSASKDYLFELCELAGGFGRIGKGSNGVWVWRMSTTDSLTFRDFMYSDEGFALERKRRIFFSFNESDFQRKKFSKQDDEYITECFAKNLKWSDVADSLGRNVKTLHKRTKRLGLSKQSRPVWTLREIEYIKNEFDPLSPKVSASKIANKLGKTLSSVNHKATRLGLRLSHMVARL